MSSRDTVYAIPWRVSVNSLDLDYIVSLLYSSGTIFSHWKSESIINFFLFVFFSPHK